MLSIIFYTVLLTALVFWVEGSLFLVTNPLILKPKPGDELEVWLKKFNWANRHDLKDHGPLPSYKFYSGVVETLLSLARKMGGNYQEALLFLREGLQTDRQFEKKIREMNLGCWMQMLFVMGLTWAFILGSLYLVEIQVSGLKLLLIASWQILGLAVLPVTLKRLRRKLFGDIGKLWKMLYVLSSLARVPLSRSEVFALAEVQELNSIEQKSLAHIVLKLKETCQKALKLGGSYEEEIKYLMEELRFQEKWHGELFEKRLTVIKLVLLSVFFLPSYLAFIFLLLGDLMALM